MHILGAYLHIFVRYEASMIKSVTGRAVHRCWCWQWWRWCQWWHWHWWRWQRQRHTMDRAWLHRLITKWAKKLYITFSSVPVPVFPPFLLWDATMLLKYFGWVQCQKGNQVWIVNFCVNAGGGITQLEFQGAWIVHMNCESWMMNAGVLTFRIHPENVKCEYSPPGTHDS